MNKKISILTITLILTIIVFIISTYMQKKIINYEPTVKCLVLKESINAGEKLSEEKFQTAELPITLIGTIPILQDFNEISDLYSKDNIYKGQIALKSQFDTKENLSIYEAEDGKEKISIKIQNLENGVSNTIRQNSYVNVYATLRSDYATNFMPNNDRLSLGDELDGYTVIKILDNTRILGTFNVDGIEVNNSSEGIIDSIMVSVTNDEAKQINLLREIASFNITGVNNKVEESIVNTEVINDIG